MNFHSNSFLLCPSMLTYSTATILFPVTTPFFLYAFFFLEEVTWVAREFTNTTANSGNLHYTQIK